MSNKLIKSKDLEAKIRKRIKIRKLLSVILVIVSILFVFLWTNVAITSVKFKNQMEQMVLGKDYFIEDVIIKKKDTYTSASGKYSLSRNYFFYYDTDKKCRFPHKYMGSMK